MNIQYIQSFAHPDQENLLFSFSEAAKNKLRVFIGEFVMEGKRVEMNDEWLYDIPPKPPVGMCIMGSLVQHKETKEWSVFVDEILEDGEDVVYRFELSPFQLHSRLFLLNLTAGQENLDNTTVQVFVTVPIPEVTKNAPDASTEG